MPDLFIIRQSAARLLAWLAPTIFLPNMAVADTILMDVRHRPPELVINGFTGSGPLVDIIREASAALGHDLQLRARLFPASYSDLKAGAIDLLPRTICTPDRLQEVDFIGPIGFQEKVIQFLVKPGREASVQSFEDLKRLRVGVKHGTYYFDELNNATDINKVESYDDVNMVHMFDRGRFDTMAILDKRSAMEALHAAGITDYAFADYSKRTVIGNYYGIAPDSPYKAGLQAELQKMVNNGRIREIYQSHSVMPPEFQLLADGSDLFADSPGKDYLPACNAVTRVRQAIRSTVSDSTILKGTAAWPN